MPMASRTARLLPVLAVFAFAICQERTEATPPADDPAEEAADDAPAVVDATSRFAFELYDRVAAGQEQENLFFSPYSIYIALAMTLEGARGETAEQMRDVLHIPSDNAEGWANPRFHEAMGALIRQLGGEGQRPYELHVANALWGDGQMAFRDAFLAMLQRHYAADLHPLDFRQAPEPSRLEINAWVEQQTQGRIEDLLPRGTIDPDTRLVLTNAIYFKAAWAMPFQEQQTQDRPFHLADGSRIEVPTMRRSQLRVKLHEGDGFQALELPYEEQALSMLILLPAEPDGLPALAEELDGPRLEQIVDSLEAVQAEVDLPKFTFDAAFNLNEALESLGMPLAFSRDADLTGMSDDAEAEQLHITDAVHKAFVDVNEQGTEAAAATGIIAGVTAMPMEMPHVQVDRPFLFLIRDLDTQVVLFLGQVYDPR